MPVLSDILEWSMRSLGAFWIVGGVLTLRAGRRGALMDRVLDALTDEREDRLVTRFLFVAGVLTTLSGIALLLASRWVLLPLSLLILAQVVYFTLQGRRFRRARDAEEREAATVADSTRNAFLLSLTVTAAALSASASGVLR